MSADAVPVPEVEPEAPEANKSTKSEVRRAGITIQYHQKEEER